MRVALAALALAACGGAPAVRSTGAQPATSGAAHAAPVPSGEKPTECLAPWKGNGPPNDLYDPRPVDEETLAKAEAAATTDVERSYARARADYDARHWPEAAAAFRAIAFDHSDDERAVYAAQLYLDSLNVLIVQAKRSACIADFARDVPRIRGIFCGARRKDNEEACRVFDRIEIDLERREAETLEKKAESEEDGDTDHRAAAEAYLAIVEQFCGTPNVYDRCDELAYDAAHCFLAAHDVAAASKVHARMLDPKGGMSKSPLTKKLGCELDASKPGCG